MPLFFTINDANVKKRNERERERGNGRERMMRQRRQIIQGEKFKVAWVPVLSL